jgi:hypothetical protein
LGKILIAVVSCEQRRLRRDLIRRTWLPTVPGDRMDTRFFVGRGAWVDRDDVVILNCGDGYGDLPEKFREISRWALKHGYRHMLKLDDDVVLHPGRALSSGFEGHDFIGRRNCINYRVRGLTFDDHLGFGAWFSARALAILASAPIPRELQGWVHNLGADDFWADHTLSRAGITLREDLRFRLLFQQIPVPRRYVESFAICVHTKERSLADFQRVFNELQQTDIVGFQTIKAHLGDLRKIINLEILDEELVELIDLSRNNIREVISALKNNTTTIERPLAHEEPSDIFRLHLAECILLSRITGKAPQEFVHQNIPPDSDLQKSIAIAGSVFPLPPASPDSLNEAIPYPLPGRKCSNGVCADQCERTHA